VFEKLLCSFLQDAYYTESAKSNSRGREYFISGFSVEEMSQELRELEARS
jgi:hypothetical protein